MFGHTYRIKLLGWLYLDLFNQWKFKRKFGINSFLYNVSLTRRSKYRIKFENGKRKYFYGRRKSQLWSDSPEATNCYYAYFCENTTLCSLCIHGLIITVEMFLITFYFSRFVLSHLSDFKKVKSSLNLKTYVSRELKDDSWFTWILYYRIRKIYWEYLLLCIIPQASNRFSLVSFRMADLTWRANEEAWKLFS